MLKKVIPALFVLSILVLFSINALHESYPDEFDNILGGHYILQGMLPYTGFFTHHGPIPYFIASFVEIFSGQSFLRFRLFYGILIALFLLGTYVFLKKRVGEKITFYPFFILFIAIESTYYWLHMLLADNVAALVFLPVYALILLKALYKKPFTLFDVGSVGALSAIGLYSSLTYTYLYVFLIGVALYLYFRNHFNGKKLFSRANILPFVLILSPHLVFLLYLLLTGSIGEYIYQNLTFNQKYYIYNYPRAGESSFINPIRYAILLTHWFLVNFYTLLLGVKTFDFGFPVNMTIGLANVAMVIYLLSRRQFLLVGMVVWAMIFTNVRSNPITSKETDYQSGVYVMLSFFNLFFLLPQLYKSLNDSVLEYGKKIIYSALMLILGIYAFFTVFHLLWHFNQKAVSKYMGTMPIIYDRPKFAPIANAVLEKDDYVWIGPFEFEELFYLNRKIPSKYHILIYGIGASPKIKEEMMSDFNDHKPKIIFFNSKFDYLGKTIDSYAKHFFDFLSANYITLADYKKNRIVYVPTILEGDKINLSNTMYILKDVADDMIKKLEQKNYIKKES